MDIKEACESMDDGRKVFWIWKMPDGHLSVGRGVVVGVGHDDVDLSSDGLSSGDPSESVPLDCVYGDPNKLIFVANAGEIDQKISSLESDNKADEADKKLNLSLLSSIKSLESAIFGKKNEKANAEKSENAILNMIGHTVFWLYEKKPASDLEGNCVSLGCGMLEKAMADGRGSVSGFSYGADGRSPLLAKLAADASGLGSPAFIPDGEEKRIQEKIDGAKGECESAIESDSDAISGRKTLIAKLKKGLL